MFESQSETVVQILVKESAVEKQLVAGAAYPAPGQQLYFHVLGSERTSVESLRNGSRIRVELRIGEQNQWIGRGRGWLRSGSALTEQRPRASETGQAVLGVATEPTRVGRANGLKVILVIPDSPAAEAGLEAGDVLVRVDGRPLENKEQLANAYRNASGSLRITVRNVRDGRDVEVEVAAPAPGGKQNEKMDAGQRRSLGVKTELAFFGASPALKVVKVESGSPAADAGIRTGMLILKANDNALESPEQLLEWEQRSRGDLRLTIVAPPDRRERTLRVQL